MKTIFTDIDGVLNSYIYDSVRKPNEGNIDETRMPLLAEIAARTGAEIVLSTSWRKHWSRDLDKRSSVGEELDRLFGKYGMRIFDKTPISLNNDRAEEIRAWLSANGAQNFVILDDIRFGWRELESHVVRTNYRIGRGLERKHVEAAVGVLNGDIYF